MSCVLDLAIGITFFYLIFSLILSGLNEMVCNFLKLRANTLRQGVIELLGNNADLAKQVYDHMLIKNMSITKKANVKAHPSYIPSRNFAVALLSVGENNDAVKKLLSFLPESAQNNIDKKKKAIEVWYDDAMDRVSGWYKRRTQYIILGIALLLSCIMNADTIMIAKSLWKSTAIRASVVSASQGLLQSTAVQDPSKSELAKLSEITNQIPDFELPIGWVSDKAAMVSGQQADPRGIPSDFNGWFYKILGLLCTTLAISLGAPFWFDMLGMFVNLRGAGKKPEKEEAKEKAQSAS